MGYIYLITNKVNGKQYIGQSICKDIKSRWKQHKVKDSKTIGKYLLSAYNKYGVENFTYKIICICFDEDCNRFEEDYIKKYNTLSPNGYNVQVGGKRIYIKKENKNILKGKNHPNYGKIYSEEEKKQMSERMKGINNPNYRKKMSEETKAKISKTMTGRKRPLSEETRQKISKALKKENRKKISEETKAKISKAMTGRKRPLSEENKQKIKDKCKLYISKVHEGNMKKVGKYDINNNLIETYNSITEAIIQNSLKRTTLSRACNNPSKHKLFDGYIYKFTS